MSRFARATGKWLVVAITLVILGFGARQAVASSMATTCPDDGWNWVGWQPSDEDCWDTCFSIHAGDLQDARRSPAGCCTCLF